MHPQLRRALLTALALSAATTGASGAQAAGREKGAVAKPTLGGVFPFHARKPSDCLRQLGSSSEAGLPLTKVAERRAKYGPNVLTQARRKPLWRLLVDQFDDSLVKVLLVTAAVSATMAYVEREDHGWVEPTVIVSILVLNAIVGVWQQRSAQGAVEALKRLTPMKARCLRNGQWVDDLPAADLVPGDIVEVRTGDRVPADCRVVQLKTTTMRVEEASLTGESTTVEKAAAPVGERAPLAQRSSLLYASTMISSGSAVAVVLRTGMHTEIGKIQRGVQQAGEEEEDTPLGRKLEAFGQQLTWLIGFICVAVWALSIPRFYDEVHGEVWRGALHHFKSSVALGVAAIPEGLPAVITLCLSLGTRRMAQRNAIVRKLPSVETLGCTTVICSDKTGTLTTNQMTVVKLVRPSGSKDGTPLLSYDVTGRSYATDDGTVVGLGARDASCKGVRELAAAAALSNDAELVVDEGAKGATKRTRKDAKAASVIATGEPTEAALLTLVGKIGRVAAGGGGGGGGAAIPSDPRAELEKVATLEFTRARKSKSALVRDQGSRGGAHLVVKGAPDSILARCTDMRLPDGSTVHLDRRARSEIEAAYAQMGKSALRCIALASKPSRSLGALAAFDGTEASRSGRALRNPDRFGELESGMTFLGLVGIRDPPRPSVAPAIASCRAAGVRVIMITGDSKETAQAVARDVGIFAPGDPVEAWTFVGKSFFDLPPSQQTSLLKSGNLVFCRVEPSDKQRLVRTLNQLGEVTAMTGDGVNDAPALRQAAIGIAMGITGTEVSKEASDMILADDNFATIVAAVEEGRAIYANMKSFIHYLITCNIGEVMAILLAKVLGLPDVLSPLHLLWVNLVTDGPPATALGFNPPEKGLMRQQPRGYSETLIPAFTMVRFALTGAYIGIVCVGSFIHSYAREFGVQPAQLLKWTQCAKWLPEVAGQADGKLGLVLAEMGLKDAGKAFGRAQGCGLFGEYSPAKMKASSMALSTLVVVECIRAFAAISEKQSLLRVPPWANPYLGLGMIAQVGLHSAILYVPQLAEMFRVRPLSKEDWKVVLAWSAPVLILEELLKLVHRVIEPPKLAARIRR